MRKSKIISVFMAAVMVASTIPMSAFAASVGSSSTDISVGADTKQNAQTQYTEIAESDTQTQVYLSVDESDLIVSLPTTIILSGTPNEKGQYIGNYSVGVKGEMSGDKVVNIEPESTTIALHQKGKLDSEATISQEQTTFDTDDFKTKTTTTGTVTAERLSAGSWNSSFNFSVYSKTGEPKDITTAWTIVNSYYKDFFNDDMSANFPVLFYTYNNVNYLVTDNLNGRKKFSIKYTFKLDEERLTGFQHSRIFKFNSKNMYSKPTVVYSAPGGTPYCPTTFGLSASNISSNDCSILGSYYDIFNTNNSILFQKTN